MHRGKGSDRKWMDRSFGAAGDYYIGFAALNPMKSISDCFVSGCTSANGRSCSTFGAQRHTYGCRWSVRHKHRNSHG
tara:strand:+ start:498 stop:728 length:231 start_codon:yes stop_codon:yes gene_type:complete